MIVPLHSKWIWTRISYSISICIVKVQHGRELAEMPRMWIQNFNPHFSKIQGLKFSGANIFFCHLKCNPLCEIKRIQFGVTDQMSEFKRKLGSEIEVREETWNNRNGLNFSFVHSYTKSLPFREKVNVCLHTFKKLKC